MKLYVLIDWGINHVIGIYEDKEEAEHDRDRFIGERNVQVIKRELILKDES